MNVRTTAFAPAPPPAEAALLGTDPIPAGPYYRADWFELEREAVFRRTWLQIGHVSELPAPGSFIVRPIEVANASLLLTRGKDGAIRAFHNVCTHRGTRLVDDAAGRASAFTCPYHGWTFGTDGALRGAPDFDRFYVDKAACALKPVAVDVCAGLIFVNLAREPEQGLRAFLGDLAGQLETLPVARATCFAEYTYEIEANWKLVYDNFQENYHLRFVHGRSSESGLGEQNPFGYPLRYAFHDPHRTMTFWTNPAPTLKPFQASAYAVTAAVARADGIVPNEHARDYFALFPNFFIIGSPGGHFSQSVMPISATRSRGVIRVYWEGDDDTASRRFAREYTMASLRDIHIEDRGMIERGQDGLSSGALDAIHLQENEVLLRHLYRQVADRVAAYTTAQAAG